MNASYPFDPELHEAGSMASEGKCSYHGQGGADPGSCTGQPVVSYKDGQDRWQSGCSRALEQLVERGEIQPLGQGA